MKNLSLLFILFIGLFSTCKDDPCEGVQCLNGGTCENGECECTPMWRGKNCGEQVTPFSITVKEVTVTKYPTNPVWDAGGKPDFFIIVSKGSSPIFGNSAKRIENADVGATWTDPGITIDDVLEPHIFELWEYDAPPYPDTLMGKASAVLYGTTNKFPETIDVDCPTCPVAFRLKLQYNY